MKKSIKISIILILSLVILMIPSIAKASSESTILKESDKYLIYNEKITSNNLVFALSSENEKVDLIFFPVAKDSAAENAKYVAYVDSTNQSYLDENLEAFLFVRDKDDTTNYIIDGEKISLKNAIDTEVVETTTKRIDVDSKETNTTEEIIDGVRTQVTKGKIVIKNNGEYSYIIIKLPTSGENDYTKLFGYAKELGDTQALDKLTFEEKLELMKNFYTLYTNLEPSVDDEAWQNVGKDMEILEPEDTVNGQQYIVFIQDKTNGIIDAQFMTCKSNYTPLYEKESVVIKETSKLPVTYDSIALIVIFVVIIVAIIIVLAIRKNASKKENK